MNNHLKVLGIYALLVYGGYFWGWGGVDYYGWQQVVGAVMMIGGYLTLFNEMVVKDG